MTVSRNLPPWQAVESFHPTFTLLLRRRFAPPPTPASTATQYTSYCCCREDHHGQGGESSSGSSGRGGGGGGRGGGSFLKRPTQHRPRSSCYPGVFHSLLRFSLRTGNLKAQAACLLLGPGKEGKKVLEGVFYTFPAMVQLPYNRSNHDQHFSTLSSRAGMITLSIYRISHARVVAFLPALATLLTVFFSR